MHFVEHLLRIVWRLFGMCKRTMTDHRKRMGPESLEGTVILRVNADIWLNRAPQIMPEIINEEAMANRAARTAVTSPAVSDITAVDFDM